MRGRAARVEDGVALDCTCTVSPCDAVPASAGGAEAGATAPARSGRAIRISATSAREPIPLMGLRATLGCFARVVRLAARRPAAATVAIPSTVVSARTRACAMERPNATQHVAARRAAAQHAAAQPVLLPCPWDTVSSARVVRLVARRPVAATPSTVASALTRSCAVERPNATQHVAARRAAAQHAAAQPV